jgi:transposase
VLGDRKKETVFALLSAIPSKPEYALLKGIMWPFRKRAVDLQPAEKTQLNRLFNYSPQLEQAYTLREQLTDIFDHDHTKEIATKAIQAWCQRVRNREIREFDGGLTTLDNWRDEITNYFLERQTSGFVEGFNHRIKVLRRRCYGIFDVKRLFQRLTLDVNGYERFGTA